MCVYIKHLHTCTCSQCFLSAVVIFSRLWDVPGCHRQRLHVLQTVELQHVHMAAAAVISGNEAAFTPFEHVFDDFLSAHFIIHAEKHRNPLTGRIFGVSEQLKENAGKEKDKINDIIRAVPNTIFGALKLQ